MPDQNDPVKIPTGARPKPPVKKPKPKPKPKGK